MRRAVLPALVRDPRTGLVLLAVLAGLLFPQIVSDQYILRLVVVAGIFVLVASAHNLLLKVGQLSLGPVAFYGLGAYTSAILATRLNVPFIPAFLAAGAVAATFGWVIGRLTLRMRSAYFVLVTIGFAEFFRLVAVNWTDLTNGPMGITAVPPPAPWFESYTPYYYAILVLVVLVLAGLYRLEHSAVGRAMQAIRENELLAQSVGISSIRYMMLAAVLSSFITGLAGSFYAHFYQFVGPEILAFDLTITIVIMVIAGGRNTLAGPALGAVVFTILPEVLRTAAVWRMAIYGLLLMLIMLYMPDGILPALVRIGRSSRARLIAARQPREIAAPAIASVPVGPAEPCGAPIALDLLGPCQERPLVPVVNFTLPDGAPLLSVDGLHVYFGGVHAVENVSFSVCCGEILAIIGPNGAGKTTILNAITRFGPITGGSVSYRGAVLNALSADQVALRGAVRTFQHTSIFPSASTRHNLILAHNAREPQDLGSNLLHHMHCRQAERHAEGSAEQILAFTQLSQNALRIARSLPYGNQRLLELGIALAAGPELLLLDEPAAGLNPTEVVELMELLRRIRQLGITVVLVEHDMRLVMNVSDRILVLDYGKQIALGSPQEIRSDARVIEAYLGRRKTDVATVTA